MSTRESATRPNCSGTSSRARTIVVSATVSLLVTWAAPSHAAPRAPARSGLVAGGRPWSGPGVVPGGRCGADSLTVIAVEPRPVHRSPTGDGTARGGNPQVNSPWRGDYALP